MVIYEAAFRRGSLFVRADIVVKSGYTLDLYEVKAKSYDTDDDEAMLNKKGTRVKGAWSPYVEDAGFQKYVLRECLPGVDVHAHLLLADKRFAATVDGLHQKFRVCKEADRQWVEPVGDVRPEALGEPILVSVNVDRAVSVLFDEPAREGWLDRDFLEYIEFLAEVVEEDRKVEVPVGKQCKTCPFHLSGDEETEGRRDGFKTCWREQRKLSDDELAQPNIFELANFRRTQELIDARIYKLADVDPAMIPISTSKSGGGLKPADRQRLQIEKLRGGDDTEFLDRKGLAAEFARFRYPLHFIDFETNAPAIPFTSGRRPYEMLAFQFSHHVVHEDGRIEHKNEYLNATPGEFPNYAFIRALKAALDGDEGTIFRYASHENTVLNAIYTQLMEDPEEVSDREALCAFIQSITDSTSTQVETWKGARSMVDLCALASRYYFSPYTQGSNSIKKVLPAVLNHSEHLQQKYSEPIYGAEDGIFSHNFPAKVWIERDEHGRIRDPYALLDPMAIDLNAAELRAIEADEKLADGGAAMVAYNRLQYNDLSDAERQALEKALLCYCELDTFAMVLIWEHWRERLGAV